MALAKYEQFSLDQVVDIQVEILLVHPAFKT